MRLWRKNDEKEKEMTTSSWEGVKQSLLMHPEYREYDSAARKVRERLAHQLGMTLQEYDDKLHWGFSEFYD